jgi:hypothetical protein
MWLGRFIGASPLRCRCLLCAAAALDSKNIAQATSPVQKTDSDLIYGLEERGEECSVLL